MPVILTTAPIETVYESSLDTEITEAETSEQTTEETTETTEDIEIYLPDPEDDNIYLPEAETAADNYEDGIVTR
jgi:hypothetical protein